MFLTKALAGVPSSNQPPDLSRIEAAKALFRGTQPKEWNTNFWKLALSLKTSNMPFTR